jgi:hypothetical protein
MNTLQHFVLEELDKEQESPNLKHLNHSYDVDPDEWDAFLDFILVEIPDEYEVKDESNERGAYKELYATKSNTRIARYYTGDDTLEAIFTWKDMKKIIDGDVKLAKKIFK